MDFIGKYITNKAINIPVEDWNRINEQYDKNCIVDALINHILNGDIQLPLRNISINDAMQSFDELRNLQCKGLVEGKVFTRYEYKYPLADAYIDEPIVGNDASNFFQQYNRFCCDSINAPSPVRVWNNRKFLESMLGALWTLKFDKVDDATFRALLSLRKYIASQFKPSVAKAIYERYNARDVLDFSSGWGDRLCGFYACKNTRSYIGIDPNKAVFQEYFRQQFYYGFWGGDKKVQLINKPAEDVKLRKECVDTIFTSPPYFNIEKYSNDELQSSRRYRKLDQWLDGFMYRTIDMCWHALKHGGYLIINLSDVYSNHQVNHLCDPMNDYIKSIGGEYVEGIGMRMMKRPNSGALKGKEGIFVEPIWVWRKP